jgi:hypothetical protein
VIEVSGVFTRYANWATTWCSCNSPRILPMRCDPTTTISWIRFAGCSHRFYHRPGSELLVGRRTGTSVCARASRRVGGAPSGRIRPDGSVGRRHRRSIARSTPAAADRGQSGKKSPRSAADRGQSGKRSRRSGVDRGQSRSRRPASAADNPRSPAGSGTSAADDAVQAS